MIQTYFEFTKPGALNFYNELLTTHIKDVYNDYFMNCNNPHYLVDEDVFVNGWLNSSEHKTFAKTTSPHIFSDVVEKQNKIVREQFNSLDTLVLEDKQNGN